MINLDALEAQLAQTIRDRETAGDGAHDIAHLQRVRANALRIAEMESGTNQRVLLAAVWLHDAVHVEKSDPRRTQASRMAADFARQLLPQYQFSPSEIEAVAHAIEAHSFSAGIPPVSLEAKILRDADRLDAVGAIGIARCFYVSGRLNRPLYDPADPWANSRPLDDSRFALDHFPVKLLKLESDMLTASGKGLARARTAFMRQFLEEIRREIG